MCFSVFCGIYNFTVIGGDMKWFIGINLLHGIPAMLIFLGLRGGSYEMGGLVISDMIALIVGIVISLVLRGYYEFGSWLINTR